MRKRKWFPCLLLPLFGCYHVKQSCSYTIRTVSLLHRYDAGARHRISHDKRRHDNGYYYSSRSTYIFNRSFLLVPPRSLHCLFAGGTRKSSSNNSSTKNNNNNNNNSHKDTTTPLLYTLVPGTRYESELEVKKSRFIAYAQHVASWTEASHILTSIRQEHSKARHWCHGYRGTSSDNGSSIVTERSSDDGEPSGTAGSPILQALRTAPLTDVLCVVVRYYGGIQLGTGGLIRAYGGVARMCLEAAPTQTAPPPQVTVRIQVEARYQGAVYDVVSRIASLSSLNSNGARASDETYGEDGLTLGMTVTCDAERVDALKASLQDATKGSVVFLDS
jgi:uncharacterized YigZ family protein